MHPDIDVFTLISLSWIWMFSRKQCSPGMNFTCSRMFRFQTFSFNSFDSTLATPSHRVLGVRGLSPAGKIFRGVKLGGQV